MSIVARVFVVLNLILSVAFLIFALQIWTAKTKWQKMYEEERKVNILAKADIQKRIVDLSDDTVRKEEWIKQHKQRIRELYGKVQEANDSILALQSRVGEAEAKVSMWQALNEELVRENGRRADELAKVKGVLLKQQQMVQVARDNEVKARNEKAEMENDLNSTKQTLAAVYRDKRAIEDDLAIQTRRIETLLAKNVPVWEYLQEDPEATQPYIPDAMVLSVKPELNLVMISVGSAQGVKPGYRFTISRGDQYIAKAQVERVYPDMSSARLLLKKGEVEIHDEVKSRVSSAKQ
ncbi:MAG: hypothetical protein KIS92_02895 [Planctomycetota bacterium]|nr:hypothetical protein [Planctomycetota bacterium]